MEVSRTTEIQNFDIGRLHTARDFKMGMLFKVLMFIPYESQVISTSEFGPGPMLQR
ncbi:MAG: hypothetical protein KDA84_12860 [Planctomycetaceae bacterium]|nr:hypothetical protein [Planctomycetaceae bacterium]